jgi:protein-disulfide isomerase
MSKAAWIIFGSVIVALLGGLIIYSRLSSPSIDVSGIENNSIVAASDQNGQIGDHAYGNTDSKVILLEYGDFQCPSCEGAHPQVKEVMEEYKDRVLFIFRNFPITSAHPNARAAAGAVEAAGLQGKYWEMHNLVFESLAEWNTLTGSNRTNKFTDYARSLELDVDRFVSDMGSEAVNKKISFDQALGKSFNVTSTPTFFLNGNEIDEETSATIVRGSTDELKALLDDALKQ